MARHRPTAEGGYQRGEETRSRIIEAAVGQFAEHGYEGASTRHIATAAGVNAPALQYYFDNKEGLYLACLEQILSHIWGLLSGVVCATEAALDDPQTTDEQLIEAYLGILGGLMSFLEETAESTHWHRFMACEQAGLGPPAASEVMANGLSLRLSTVTRAVVGRLSGHAADDEITIIRTVALNSQTLVFRVKRLPVFRALGWESIDRQRMEIVRNALLSLNRLTLRALANERNATTKL